MKRLKSQLYDRLTRALPGTARALRTRMGRVARRFPRTLSVELTNRCNAACIMCPRRQMTRPQGVMAPEVFDKILQDAVAMGPALQLFQPFLFGESLLHPKFPDWIRRIRERLPEVKLYLSTNGALLTPEQAHAILEARVDKLNVDIDGVSPAVAESIRRQVPLARVEENVAAFLSLREQLEARTRLRVSIIRLPQNEHEIESFRQRWEPTVDQVQIVDCNNWLGSIEETVFGRSLDSIPFDFPCRHPYEELAIAWDGRATLCCLDFDLRHPVGDIRQSSLTDIWRGPRLEAARTALEAGAYPDLPICRRCNAAKFQQNQLWRHLWTADRAG